MILHQIAGERLHISQSGEFEPLDDRAMFGDDDHAGRMPDGVVIDSLEMLTQSRRVIRLEQHGARWELSPDFAPHLDAVLKSEGRIIKESPVKCVTRHEVAGRVWFVKRYQHEKVALRPLKFFFKPAQARQEWAVAQQLEKLGVSTVRHVALGERWGVGLRESILITEGFAGVPLDEAPAIDLGAVLKFVHHLHEHGVLQRDLHPGNILLNQTTGEMRLVDLHGTVIKPGLTQTERDANLAFLRIFLPVPVSPAVAQQSAAMRKRYLAHRAWRCLKHNREFEPCAVGGLHWFVRRPRVDAPVTKILADPDGFLAREAEILKPGRSCTVGRSGELVLKRFNLRKLGNLAKDFFRLSKARRAYQKAYHLEIAGVPTARAIATADRCVAGLLLRGYFLMEAIPNPQHLGQWTGEPCAAARQLAEVLAKLHNEGFSHRDLKETNLVFDGAGKLHIIDLEGLEYLETVPPARAAADLARFARGAEKSPAFTPALRKVFLRRYAKSRGGSLRKLLGT
jgi:tRNA A-37 threonylcarbamoyl transferase component Bud32